MVFFLLPEDFKQRTQISAPDNLIRSTLIDVQLKDIFHVLGPDLYNDLYLLVDRSLVDTDPYTRYFNLLYYIQPAMQKRAEALIAESNSVVVNSSGVLQSSNSISRSDLQQVLDFFNSKWYDNALQLFNRINYFNRTRVEGIEQWSHLNIDGASVQNYIPHHPSNYQSGIVFF